MTDAWERVKDIIRPFAATYRYLARTDAPPEKLTPFKDAADFIALNDEEARQLEFHLIKILLRNMTDNQRLDLFYDYCTHCGGTEKPCFCERDD